MSERRACTMIGCCADDGAVSVAAGRMTAHCAQRLRALAHERRRFGYRRLHILLRREGFAVNHKRLFRLYREERLIGPPAWRPQASDGHAGADAWSRHGRMNAGRSTSSPISSSTAAACASWPWSTTARANAWRWSPTPRSPGSGWPANSIGSLVASR